MKEKRYAICIGCNNYPKDPERLPTLKCAENDAKELKEILADPKRGNFDDIKLFTNEPHYDILPAIEKLLSSAKKDNLILIYYSGHGRLDNRNRLCLATSSTEVTALATTSLPVARLKEFIDDCSATKIVWILDCCYSGAVDKAFKGGDVDSALQIAAGGKGKYIITASTGIQVAHEKEQEPHSVFTKYLLEGLMGEADLNRDGIITIEGLFRYVHKQVTDEGGQEPLKFAIDVTGDIPIAKVPPPIPPRPESPYFLGNEDLSLTKFPDVLTETKDDDGKINIAFIFGPGRSLISDHVSYGTDALFIHEIAALLKDWNPNIHFNSYLDIDIYNAEDLKNKNLFLIGSGKVNFVTMKMLEQFGENLKVKFLHPGIGPIFSSCGRNKIYRVEYEDTGRDAGILSLTRNPWAANVGKQRIIVLIAGAHPIGSIAVMYLLIEYIKNPEIRENNRLDQNVPAKIVRGKPIGYNEYRQRIPEVTERAINTPTYIGNIKDWEIIE